MVKNPDKLLDLVIKREELHNTAIDEGIAVPHPRLINQNIVSENMVVIRILKNGIDFSAPDN